MREIGIVTAIGGAALAYAYGKNDSNNHAKLGTEWTSTSEDNND
jgi:hypothetical protein